VLIGSDYRWTCPTCHRTVTVPPTFRYPLLWLRHEQARHGQAHRRLT
jgi:hypothetical protein